MANQRPVAKRNKGKSAFCYTANSFNMVVAQLLANIDTACQIKKENKKMRLPYQPPWYGTGCRVVWGNGPSRALLFDLHLCCWCEERVSFLGARKQVSAFMVGWNAPPWWGGWMALLAEAVVYSRLLCHEVSSKGGYFFDGGGFRCFVVGLSSS